MSRRLRIVTSVFFAVLTVALCVLWVRSDRQVETLGRMYGYRIEAEQGMLNVVERTQSPIAPTSLPVTAMVTRFAAWMPSRTVVVASIPLWIPMIVASVIATISGSPWLTWHFSLRTLLLATTLVAIALGLGVWLAS